MEQIRKKYIVDENQKKIAVQINIGDFEKMEQIMEDYALGKLMDENDPKKNLTLEEAKEYYQN